MGTLQSFLAMRRSGLVVATAGALVIATLLVAYFALGMGWVGSWNIFIASSYEPAFLDFHTVVDMAACGIRDASVYVPNNCDALHRLYNYPLIWLRLGDLGITVRDVPWMGTLLGLLTFTLICVHLSGRSVASGLFFLPAVFSPAMMLGFERGNTDLVIWGLLFFATSVFSESRPMKAAGAYLLMFIAVVLKLYPVFCAALFMRLRRWSMVGSLALLAASALYFYVKYDEIGLIQRNTEKALHDSFGFRIAFVLMPPSVPSFFGFEGTGDLALSWVPVVFLLLVLASSFGAALLIRRAASEGQPCRIGEGREGTAFICGAAIFCGAFLFLTTSYVYRLIFLIFCLPQLFDWMKGEMGKTQARIAWVTFASMLGSMWLKLHDMPLRLADHLPDWILFFMLMTVFFLNVAFRWEEIKLQMVGRAIPL